MSEDTVARRSLGCGMELSLRRINSVGPYFDMLVLELKYGNGLVRRTYPSGSLCAGEYRFKELFTYIQTAEEFEAVDQDLLRQLEIMAEGEDK